MIHPLETQRHLNIMLDLNRSRNLPRLLPALIVSLNLLMAGRAPAQTFTTLYSFTAIDYQHPPFTNSDGSSPLGRLILSGSVLYGVTTGGGTSGHGSVFRVGSDGKGFTNLYSFSGGVDGYFPDGLVLSGNILYGTTRSGGNSGWGNVFAMHTDGTDFINLHSFSYLAGDGGYTPICQLIVSGNTLYGTTSSGGTSDQGAVFAVNTDGTGFTNLHSLNGSEGDAPQAGLILSGGALYGTTYGGGGAGCGTVFKVNTNGTGFANLHSFNGNDGAGPEAGLILSGNTLYGTTLGTVYAVHTNGTGFTNLHSFNGDDGAYVFAGLISAGNTLYGIASSGGSSRSGTAFALNTNGTSFTNFYTFSGDDSNSINRDGYSPVAALILSNNILYGTAEYGGSTGNGTVFSISFAPQLAISLAGINVILTWPTNVAGFNYSGFTLQSATNPLSSAPWSNINGHYAVTNPITGPQKFFRLSQ
jgi:uncharacterized repeat protein (TIGR03803 family)